MAKCSEAEIAILGSLRSAIFFSKSKRTTNWSFYPQGLSTLYSQNPYPFGFPVSLSYTSRKLRTTPTSLNMSLICSSVASYGIFPTKTDLAAFSDSPPKSPNPWGPPGICRYILELLLFNFVLQIGTTLVNQSTFNLGWESLKNTSEIWNCNSQLF